MKTDVEFGSFTFDEDWPHPRGNVPLSLLGDLPSGEMAMMWGVRKGCSYPPETHCHAHVLFVAAGRGIFSWNGLEHVYAQGDRFDVKSNEPHGFILVEETTIVVQAQRRKGI